MSTQPNIYERYTSTSALAAGLDRADALNWTTGYFRAQFGRHLPQSRSARILEIGCGYGGNLAALREMGYTNCVGIDLSAEQIAHAQSVLGLGNVELADALDWLSGRDGEFDAIIAIDLLEHLPTDALLKMGENVREALKPGGCVIIQVPNGTSPLNPYLYGDLTHVRAFTPQSMQQFFLLVGLTPVGYFEAAPHVHGVRSAVRRAVWSAILRPAIGAMMSIVRGKAIYASVYTANLIAVARKAA